MTLGLWLLWARWESICRRLHGRPPSKEEDLDCNEASLRQLRRRCTCVWSCSRDGCIMEHLTQYVTVLMWGMMCVTVALRVTAAHSSTSTRHGAVVTSADQGTIVTSQEGSVVILKAQYQMLKQNPPTPSNINSGIFNWYYVIYDILLLITYMWMSLKFSQQHR